MKFLLALIANILCVSVYAADNAYLEKGKAAAEAGKQKSASAFSSGGTFAQEHVPSYGTTPAEQSIFAGGKGNVIGAGTQKLATCGANLHDKTTREGQECEAVNALARNPQIRPQFDLSNNPALKNAHNMQKNAEQLFAQSFPNINLSETQCQKTTITQPAAYQDQKCSILAEFNGGSCTIGRVVKIDTDANFQCDKTINAYETFKCRRGFSPNFNVQVNTDFYNPNYGSEVPAISAKTFNMVVTIPNDVTIVKATLKRYQADNYGQLWVNNNLIIQNVLSGDYKDMRNGYVKKITGRRNGIFSAADNSWTATFWDDGCNWGCRGVNLNNDITNVFKKGENTITIVCLNVGLIGPCAFQIEIMTEKKIVTGSTIQNGCAELEARAR